MNQSGIRIFYWLFLCGLDRDYETIVSLFTYQMDDINLENVQYLLLMYEDMLSLKNSFSSSALNFEGITLMDANVASHRSKNGIGLITSRGGFSNEGGRG